MFHAWIFKISVGVCRRFGSTSRSCLAQKRVYELLMKRFGWLLVLLAEGFAWAVPPQDEPIVKAVEKVRPAVVNIYTEGVVTQEVRDPRDV